MKGSISEDSVLRIVGHWQSRVSKVMRSVVSSSEEVQSSRRSDESSSSCASSEMVEMLNAGVDGVSLGELPEGCRTVQLVKLYDILKI